MDDDLPNNDPPTSVLDQEPPKKRGRPRKDTGIQTSSEEQDEGQSTDEPGYPQSPASSRSVKAEIKRDWKALSIGDTIQWVESGYRDMDPYAAMITSKGPDGCSLGLTIWAPELRGVHRTITGVRHVDDPSYVKHQREEIGAWCPTPLQVRLMEYLDD